MNDVGKKQMFQLAASRYSAQSSGDPVLVYRTICQVLSNRAQDVAWPVFTDDDWDLMKTMAAQERVGPLLYWHFTKGSWPIGFPDDLAESLMRSYHGTVVRNTFLLGELTRVLDVLAKADIPVIVLKGAALAQTLYPDPALRPMNDLDLLVREKSIAPILRILRGLNYSKVTEISSIFEHFVRSHQAIRNDAYLIELHWSLVVGKHDHRRPNLRWLWEHTVTFGYDNLRMLTPTANVLHLAAHLGVQHGLFQLHLLWLYDLYLLLDKKSTLIDWDEVINRSVEFGWVEGLYDVLEITRVFFNANIPNRVLLLLDEKRDSGSVSEKGVEFASPTIKHTFESVFRGLTLVGKVGVVISYLFPAPAYMD
ncbi:MAG: nucleotidyltransferase family protein, partial [Anaerolineales bacterium]